MKFLLLLLLAIGATINADQDPHDPATELASFQMAEGFEANLFASETNGVVNPIQIRFDPQGRLWTIISTVYPQLEPGQVPNDKVLILEDTDHDGRADRTTVFADGLMIPTGLELVKDGAYVGHGTELLMLKDTDGDGRADERQVVLRGFGTGDNHQNINSFLWGPGGELWMSQGFHTHSNIETPWGIVRLNQAGLWRFWPGRLKLEGFYGSHFEPQNPWGFAFTDWGEPIVIAGNNSSPIYPVPGLVSRRFADPPPLIWKDGQGRKSSGGDIVGNAHFPEDWQGTLILGGYINNAVWALDIVEENSGFALVDREPLIRSSSRNFRPVDVKFGPDGALYICDWYNPIIGHYQASFRHPDRDKNHGRIWRVTAQNRPLQTRPELTHLSPSELLDQLLSPDRWVRHFAKRVLAGLPADEVKPALEEWISQPDLSPHALKEALGVYQSHELVYQELLERLCRADAPEARAYAAGVVGPWADRLEDPLGLLAPLLRDPHPRVRLQALVSSTYVRNGATIEAISRVRDYPMDRFLEYAWRQAVFALKPYWLPVLKAGQLTFSGHLPYLRALVEADRSPDTLATVKQVVYGSDSPTPLFRQLPLEFGDAEDIATLIETEKVPPALMPTLVSQVKNRKLRPDPLPLDGLGKLVLSAEPEVRVRALQLAAIWNVQNFAHTARVLAQDETLFLSLRAEALSALAQYGDRESLQLLENIASGKDVILRAASIAALVPVDARKAARLAAFLLQEQVASEPAEQIFQAFLKREDGATTLANAMAQTKPSPAAARHGLNLMSASGRRHEALARLLENAAGFSPTRHEMNGRALEEFIQEVVTAGNPERGRAVFDRPELGCVACHSIQGEGGQLGPDLSALGTAQPIDFIISAILEPNREVKEGFLSISVTTVDGEEFQGYQVRENSQEVVLRDTLGSREIRLPRSQIRNRRPNGSIMPAGLVDTLSRDEFRDLVSFLSEQGKPTRR